MSKRATWKGPFFDINLYQQVCSSKKDLKLKTTSRNSTILPFLVNKIIHVYNGKLFFKLLIREEMLGHKLGSFIPSRLRHFHKNKNQKKLKSLKKNKVKSSNSLQKNKIKKKK